MKNLFTIIFIFTSVLGFAQLPKDTIAHKKNIVINISLLERLTLEELNRYRMSKGVYKLQIVDSICDSAKKHSEWMYKEDKFEHSKISDGAENCLHSPLYMGFTYEDIAKNIIKSWVKSSKHNSILLTSDFKNVGLGIKMFTDKDGYKSIYTTLQIH